MRVNVALYLDEDGVPSQGVYGKYLAMGHTDVGVPGLPGWPWPQWGNSDMMTLYPKCLNTVALGAACRADQVAWVSPFPRWFSNLGAIGMQGALRGEGTNTVDLAGGAFEHFNGVALQGDNLRLDNTARIRLRKQVLCTPPLSYLVDCWHDAAAMQDAWQDEGGNRCLVALDDKGYRVFNDLVTDYGAALVWHCRDHIYCEGERVDAGLLKRVQQLSVDNGGSRDIVPPLCPAGQRNGYLVLGEDDWGLDVSLHECGLGDRSLQHKVCKQLPSTPAFGNPTGWFFNTTCKHRAHEQQCGHSGWFMEGGYVASCTTAADCQIDDTVSTLSLYINLEREGSLSFTYTAHGEEFFDYMLFEVNDERVHHTQVRLSNILY